MAIRSRVSRENTEFVLDGAYKMASRLLRPLHSRVKKNKRLSRPCRRPTFEILERRNLLAAVSWTGNGDGSSWNDAANWEREGIASLPQAGDDVTIGNVGDPGVIGDVTIDYESGSLSLNSLTSQENLRLTGGVIDVVTSHFAAGVILDGGTLNIGQSLVLDGNMAFTAGAIAGGGIFNVESSATVDISSSATKFIGNVTFQGAGTIEWSDGAIQRVSSVSNNPTFNVSEFRVQAGTPRVLEGVLLNNAGTMVVSGGGGLLSRNFAGTSVGSTVANLSSGVLRVDSDFVIATQTTPIPFINEGAIVLQTGTFRVDGPARFNAGSQISGSGAIDLTLGGSWDITGAIDVSSTLRFEAGRITGPGPIHLDGSGLLEIIGPETKQIGNMTIFGGGRVLWSEGNLQRVSSIENQPIFDVSEFRIDGNAVKALDGLLLNNAGTMVVSGGGGLLSRNFAGTSVGSTLTNLAGGVLRTESDFTLDAQTTPTLLVNEGAINTSGGDLVINGPSIFREGAAVSGSDALVFGAGISTIEGISISIPNLGLNSGELALAGDLSIGERFRWRGGAFSGSPNVTLAEGAAMTIEGPTTKFIGNVTFQGAGTIEWSDGAIQRISSVSNNPTFNVSEFRVQAGTPRVLEGVLLNNAGTMVVSGGGGLLSRNFAGTSVGSTVANLSSGVLRVDSDFVIATQTTPIPFINEGAIVLQTGTFRVDGPARFNAGSQISGSGAIDLTLGGSWDITGAIDVSSTLRFEAGRITGPGPIHLDGSGLLEIIGPETKQIGNMTIFGGGRVLWSEGNLQRVSSIENQPIFDVSEFRIDGNAVKALDGLLLNNAGTMVVSGGGGLLSRNFAGTSVGSTLTNLAGGVLRTESDFTLDAQTTPTVFRNFGSLEIFSGTLEVIGNAEIDFGNNQSFQLKPRAGLRFSNSVVVSGANQIEDGISLLGDFEFQGMTQLEAFSADLGTVAEGFVENASLGSLTVSGGTLTLQDIRENAPGGASEAVYVDSLFVGPSAVLDLNGLNLYARAAAIEGTVIGGTISLIDGTGQLTLNLPVTGSISAPSEIDQWSISLTAGDSVTLIVDPGGSQPGLPLPPQLGRNRARLISPSGQILAERQSVSNGEIVRFDAVAILESGDHLVEISATDSLPDATGNYRLMVGEGTLDISPLIVNTRLNGQIEKLYSVDRWTFAASEGTLIGIDLLGSNTFGLSLSLVGPGGESVIVEETGSIDPFVLPASGSYELTLQTNGQSVGDYAFRLNSFDAIDLPVNSIRDDIFLASGDARLFAVEITESQPIRISLELLNSPDQSNSELYIRKGVPPTRREFDVQSISSNSEESIEAALATPGTWFVLAYPENVVMNQPFRISTRAQSIFLDEVSPSLVNPDVDVRLTVGGLGFIDGTTLKLASNTGDLFDPVDLQIDSVRRLTATFNLSIVSDGNYDIVVTHPDGTVQILEDGLTVDSLAQGRLETELLLPRLLLRQSTATLYVRYANTGTAPIPAPVLTVQSSDPDGSDKPLLTLDQSRLVNGFWTTANPRGFSESVEIYAQGKNPGVILPGESLTVPIYYAGLQQPWDTNDDVAEFELLIREATDTAPVEWQLYAEGARPEGVDPRAWASIIGNLQADLGTTWGEYIQRQNQAAGRFGQLGREVISHQDYFQFFYAWATGYTIIPSVASSIDANRSTSDLPLQISRRFGTSIDGRYNLGVLGRGWSVTQLASVTESIDGTAEVEESGGLVRVFQPDRRRAGHYLSSSDDLGKLLKIGGEFVLTEPDGSNRRFGVSGLQLSQTDPIGRQLTYSYDAQDRLISLEHSNGAFLVIAYNSAGRIERIDDDLGRSTFYQYDPANELLLAVTTPEGTTNYTYDTSENDATRFALLSTEDPSGVLRTFEYDPRGRLVAVLGEIGNTLLSIAYPETGIVRVSDVNGLATYEFDHELRVARLENPAGVYRLFDYDVAGNLIASVDSLGGSKKYTYDDDGQLLSETNQNGDTVKFVPGGPNNQPSIFIDAGQNSIEYRYDSNRNLIQRIFPDGTSEKFNYDANGYLSSRTNRRDQTTLMRHNAEGQLLEEVRPEGKTIRYEYDNLNRLKLIDDDGALTAYQYGVANRISRIDYPNSRWLDYQYDAAGRITELLDHAGNRTGYRYDANGLLIQLLDATDHPITTYTYDTLGRLIGETKANGTQTLYGYDEAGRVLSITNELDDGTDQSRFVYSYDMLGRRISMDTMDGIWNYGYDASGQLTTATFASTTASIPDRVLRYIYDVAGNRVEIIDNGSSTPAIFNELNQVIQSGETTFAYDDDGNLVTETTPEGVTTYNYDSQNRLVSIVSPEGTFQYEYDAFGNRIAVVKDGSRTEQLISPIGVWELPTVVAQYDAGGTQTQSYTYGLGLTSTIDSGNRYFYDYDALGSVYGVTGLDGVEVNENAYLPFGELLFANESLEQPFGFVGLLGLIQDESELVQMRARYYSPEDARFTSQDPIGIAGGYNLYGYVGNRPTEFVDPTGENKIAVGIGVGVAVGLASVFVCFASQTGQLSPFGSSVAVEVYGEECRPRKRMPDPPPPDGRAGDQGTTPVRTSSDPNDKFAGVGVGESGFIRPETVVPYRIRFENLGPGSDPVPANPATAPAQRVVITDQLSGNLDWSTVRFTGFGWGDTRVAITEPGGYFFKTQSLTIGEETFDVEVELSFDSSNGLITAVFQSIEPGTELPPVGAIGFLPPEDGTGVGQGFLTFEARPIGSIPDTTEIRNVALISFDGQTIIATNQIDPQDPSQGTDPLLEALVTIDASPPSSFITLVQPNESGDQLTIHWSGDDGQGSGIASYTLFVAINGSDPVVLIPYTDQVETTIPIDPSRTYQFFVSAIDHVGNRNALPTGFLGDSIAATHDYGDAPSQYPVELILDGARHFAIGPRLGTYRDAEFSGQADDQALGDDWLGDLDDEDGVSVPDLTAGQQSVVIVVDVQEAPDGAFLNAWIDFDQDGFWDALADHIAVDQPVANGLNEIVFHVPSSASPGTTFARFRLSTQPGLGTTGSAPDGEVEDYMLTIVNQPPVLTRSAAQVNGGVLTEIVNSGTWSDPESGLVSLSASVGTITKNSDGTWHWSYIPPLKLVRELVTITADDGANQTLVTFEITTEVNVTDQRVYYKGSDFAEGGSNIPAALDPLKVIAVAGAVPQTLSYSNLINSSRGINGIVLDIAGLGSDTLTTADLIVRMSPQGVFEEAANPPGNWTLAPQPSVFVTSGTATTPARVRLEWPDDAITNRWLRIEVRDTPNTGLIKPEVFYVGHLLGETTGPSDGVYTVSFADIAMIRAAIGQSVGVGSIYDIDKNRIVSFADISAMRSNVGAQLTNITIPAASSESGQTMFNAPVRGSGTKDSQRGGQVTVESFQSVQAAPRIDSDAVWFGATDAMDKAGEFSKELLLRQRPLLFLQPDQFRADREEIWNDATDHFFEMIEFDIESLALVIDLDEMSEEEVSIKD
jgi:RHS repeat-associated protein